MAPSDDGHEGSAETGSAWLCQGLESLVELFPHVDSESGRPDGQTTDVDLVIVGSGYGAAIAAHEFAGRCEQDSKKPLQICILERGIEYPQGAFPSRMADLAGHVRFSTPASATPRGRRTGLFDVRLSADVMAVVANGVGGGSLINAGVMLRPDLAQMRSAPWPKEIRTEDLRPHYDAVQPLLGAGSSEHPNSVDGTPLEGLAKVSVMRRLGAESVPITVALRAGERSMAGIPLNACVGCGDCATGCNHGAKISLDVGLLAHACSVDGVKLYTGATVLYLEKLPLEIGWSVVIQHTDEKLRLRQPKPFRLHTMRVILAAGTFGSTEILLRSRQQDKSLVLSPMLGQRFSTNGDLIASVHGMNREVSAVADEDVSPQKRGVGPTITSMIDLRGGNDGFVIQDLSVPGPLRKAFEELFTTSSTLHSLQDRDWTVHGRGDADPCAVDSAVIESSLPLAMIGRDDSGGCLQLTPAAGNQSSSRAPAHEEGDGALLIKWPEGDEARWLNHHTELQHLFCSSDLGGRVLPNPVWQLLPAGMQRGLDVPNGPMITVHPLGGCPMGDDSEKGVVNHMGCVFDATDPTGSTTLEHRGLAVLDGSVVPVSLGINPALTIAALAHRSAQLLRKHWELSNSKAGPTRRLKNSRRPEQIASAREPILTRIELMEQVRGRATFAHGEERWIELTLYSRPTVLRTLMLPRGPRRLEFDELRSTLKIFETNESSSTGVVGYGQQLLECSIAGTLTLFRYAPSTPLARTLEALKAWWLNRGFRDIAQSVGCWIKGQGTAGLSPRMFSDIVALATRAGAARLLEYEFTVHGAKGLPAQALAALFPDGTRFKATKRLSYGLAASPLRQLMEVTLTQFPGLGTNDAPVLTLHLPFLADKSVPLMRVVRQQDQPTALVDVACFLGYVSRILVDGHLWSFRKPDKPSRHKPKRLPGDVPSHSPFWKRSKLVVTRHWIVVDSENDVRILLTRYRPTDARSDFPPVLLIHGYSASGTTFAHHTLRPSLTGFLTETHKRDVWILDMRSSCGMPTADRDWAFEDMGCEDIPRAVEEICKLAPCKHVDIVAHCMGVAMLFMGLLGGEGLRKRTTAVETLRHKLWNREGCIDDSDDSVAPKHPPLSRIRSLVMSQVGPALQLTPANIARSYLMRYVKQFIPDGRYEFRPEEEGGLANQLLDRLLAALPYPEGEFERENPWWPPGKTLPWVGTRHRVDALFGRVFNLEHMSNRTLKYIDDFFGPFSVETVSQVMYFARYKLITDRAGFGRFMDPRRMARRLTFPMLSLHSRENGLADVETMDVLFAALKGRLGPGGSLEQTILFNDTQGHQDSLIGTANATRSAFEAIADFHTRVQAGEGS